MSFPDPPPPPPFMPPPFAGGDIGGFWPQFPMNNEDWDSNSPYEYGPPLKRPRNSGINQPNSVPFPPMNPRINTMNPKVNRGVGYIFYKTRMCLKFSDGNCQNGEHCTFAHGAEDLREPPPNWKEIVGAREKDRGTGNWNDDQRFIHKMKICKMFYNGEECPYGEKCNFLHEDLSRFKNEMGSTWESPALNIGTTGPMMVHRSGSDQPEVNDTADALRFNVKPTYWKTKSCIKWEMTGHCLFGERCHFAHGQSEIQLPGGRMDTEAVHTLNIPTKPVAVPENDVPASKTLVTASAKEDGDDGKKCFSKWKGPKKINRIYADWIDDLTPPQSLPSKLES